MKLNAKSDFLILIFFSSIRKHGNCSASFVFIQNDLLSLVLAILQFFATFLFSFHHMSNSSLSKLLQVLMLLLILFHIKSVASRQTYPITSFFIKFFF